MTGKTIYKIKNIGSLSLDDRSAIGNIAIFPPANPRDLGHAMIKGLGDSFIGAGSTTVNIRSASYMTSGYGPPSYWKH
jgi:hypothetical protein